MRKKNVAGDRFYSLVAIKPTGERQYGSVVWECLCDCGKTINLPLQRLCDKTTKSCGCIKRKNGKDRVIDMAEKNCRKYYEGTAIVSLTANLSVRNTSGIKGVSWHKRDNAWQVHIGFKNKLISVGKFKNKTDAIKARKRAEEIYYHPLIEKYGGNVK